VNQAGGTSRGAFIVLEGIDGSGSTTQARLLVERLIGAGMDALFTCEPSDGPIGELIRRALQRRLSTADGDPVGLDWATLSLLFAADRADHAERTILPALKTGRNVVSDRYDLSSLAYQSATSDSAPDVLSWIRQLNSRVLRPDLTFIVDVAAETAERRRLQRGAAAELFEVPELQRKLAEIYRMGEQLVPLDRVVHVDGEQDVASVAAEIWAEACRIIGAKSSA
jgi:dTMP kinase